MVNFMCQSDWMKGYQVADRTCWMCVCEGFLDVSMRICTANKKHPERSTIHMLQASTEDKDQQQQIPLLLLRHPSSPNSDTGGPGYWAFRLDLYYTIGFLVLQLLS